jgi:hypothetical protein
LRVAEGGAFGNPLEAPVIRIFSLRSTRGLRRFDLIGTDDVFSLDPMRLNLDDPGAYILSLAVLLPDRKSRIIRCSAPCPVALQRMKC